MNSIPVKRISIKDYVKENEDKLVVQFSFSKNIRSISNGKEINFKENNDFSIDIGKKEVSKGLSRVLQESYPTLREAFDACVDENLKLVMEYETEIIPKSNKLWKYSFVGQLFEKNKADRKIVDDVITNVEKYKKFLTDKKVLDKYYDDNYKEFEDIDEDKITVPDPDFELGDKVYMFFEQFDFHHIEDKFDNLFSVEAFSISNMDYDYSFYRTLDKKGFSMSNSVDVRLRVETEFVKTEESDRSNYGAPTLSFTMDKEDGKNVLRMCQGCSSYRLFLRKDELDTYLKSFKSAVINELENL